MKKTIAAVALMVSAQANAMPAYRDPKAPQPKIIKVCMSLYVRDDGSKYGGCDESRNNAAQNVQTLPNGCTSDQVALTFLDKSPIEACLPPGVAQL